jgi:hypothetical protein
MPSPSMDSGEPGTPYDDNKHQWDINDTNLPVVSNTYLNSLILFNITRCALFVRDFAN